MQNAATKSNVTPATKYLLYAPDYITAQKGKLPRHPARAPLIMITANNSEVGVPSLTCRVLFIIYQHPGMAVHMLYSSNTLWLHVL